MQKTIFITGASAGLGKSTAKLFQSKGWNVIATMRKPENETELAKLENVTILKLDVTDNAQIEDTVQKVIQQYTVDVVLNNAGYGLIGVIEALTDEQITRQIDTNLLGVIRVTKAFIPHFREKRNGTFINVTSMFGLIGYPTCSVYSATKFAIDGFSESLAYDLAHFGVKVKTIAPGGIQTDFAGRSLDGGHHEAYQTLMAKVSEGYSAERISQFATAEHVASVIYEAANDNKEQLRYIAGKDAISLYSEREKIGAEAQYRKIQEMFIY
ncbi:NAD(P)-dependent dehydrogenase (short-subunit alcohol dehydrogenase family) [Runella defluvii]|uniref:NAD(P)-dependent dehydrogenase (Short-subunit alcohol dehydrogenase family) n=1 Tax=Runella defluvii TaxID=370973 RepID=A0A7W5ZJJ8_9BACT|nr:SDR family oxidoreductase [Runella defluvii]MBB3838281.1 NAD(P)-dependent dehydrogenase (short-subunit alcohol dehydrogenase family) [Runella defluvii]